MHSRRYVSLSGIRCSRACPHVEVAVCHLDIVLCIDRSSVFKLDPVAVFAHLAPAVLGIYYSALAAYQQESLGAVVRSGTCPHVECSGIYLYLIAAAGISSAVSAIVTHLRRVFQAYPVAGLLNESPGSRSLDYSIGSRIDISFSRV